MRRPSPVVLVFSLALLALALLLAPAGAAAKPAPKKPHAKPPAGTFVARIGWFYNDEPDFPQQKMSSVKISWPACVAAGGVNVDFPLNQHIYGGYNGNFSTTEAAVAGIVGPPLNTKDQFVGEIYVGDLATPGTRNLTLSCMHLSHGKLVAVMTGPLKTKFIHKDVQFSTGSFDSFDQVDLFGLEPNTYTVTNRSCEEPGTPSITLSAPLFAPGPKGGAYVTVPAADEDGTFTGLITPAPGTPAGTYEAVVSCGSGRVGVGKVGLTP
jgi:hypothetical protein